MRYLPIALLSVLLIIRCTAAKPAHSAYPARADSISLLQDILDAPNLNQEFFSSFKDKEPVMHRTALTPAGATFYFKGKAVPVRTLDLKRDDYKWNDPPFVLLLSGCRFIGTDSATAAIVLPYSRLDLELALSRPGPEQRWAVFITNESRW